MSDRHQQLAIFIRAVETGSFSKVVREFGLSQLRLADAGRVEERLGVKLLTRTTHQLSPTPQGLATMAGSLQRELCR